MADPIPRGSEPAVQAGPAQAPAASRKPPRRAHLTGRHFVISWQRLPVGRAPGRIDGEADAAASPAATGRATALRTPAGPGAAAGAKPMMAVPKKLVPSSPLRNAVRRVVREAVRAAGIVPMPPVLVRLVSLPETDAPPPGARRAFDRRLPDGAFKRACRADVDMLLARLKQALAGRPR